MQNLFSLFVGIDVGSSRTKLVILNQKKEMLGWIVKKSGVNFKKTADSCLVDLLDYLGLKKRNINKVVSTGYGRKNVTYSTDNRTEIACHSKGCFYHFPFAIDIIDIGGQDNKIIKLDKNGKRISFKMNRKCAAGTGAFLEEMSLRLNISLNEMNSIAAISDNVVNLGSFCTVFSATEVLEKIKRGVHTGGIIKGLFFSVIKRIIEMDSFLNKVIITGGVVGHNPYLVNVAENLIFLPILVPERPQLTGALGAALYAMEGFFK